PRLTSFLPTLALGLSVLTGFSAPAFAVADLEKDIQDRNYPLSLSGSYLAALTAGRSRDLDAAVLYFDKALESDPQNVALIERAFMLRLADGSIEKAVELTEEILERDPKNRFARMALGVVALKSKAYKNAEKEFEQIEQGPLARLTGTLLLAWTLVAEEEFDAALDVVQKLEGPAWYESFQLYHTGLIAEAAGKMDIARENLSTAYQRDPNVLRTTEAWARFQLRHGFDEGSESLVDDLMARFSNRPSIQALADAAAADGKAKPHISNPLEGAMEVLYGLGSAIGREGGEEISYVYLQLASYLSPDHALPRLVLGDLYEDDKRYEKAIENYDAIEEGSIFRSNATMRTAFAYNSLEKLDEARAIMTELIEKEPDNIIAISSYGNILRSHELYEEARTIYDQAIKKIDPQSQSNNWSLYYSRGITNERTKRWPEAEADFRKALELSPDQPQVLNYLGYSLIDLGLNYEEALEMIKVAVGLRPNDAFIVDSLGWAYYKLERYDEAVTHLERAVELRPQDPILNDHLGDAYWKVGRKLEAVFQWSHARDLDPEPEDLDKIVEKIENGLVEDEDG
ncbi:MAG: tetratricopeptide repeat protein, partial [Pseudomonadota bacterium]